MLFARRDRSSLTYLARYRSLESARSAQASQHADAVHVTVSTKARVKEDFADLTSGIQLIQTSIAKWQRDIGEDHQNSSTSSKVGRPLLHAWPGLGLCL